MAIILDGSLGESNASWTTSGRPSSPSAGQMGFNTTLGAIETYNGSAWYQAGRAGNVIQVVQYSTGSSYSVTSTTFTATGWTGSITPQFSTSKILVSISAGQWRITTNALQEGWAQLWRSIGGGAYSALGQTGGAAGGSGDIHEILIPPANNPFAVSHSVLYLDSPNTTSQVTYQPYAKTNSSGTTIYYNMSSPVMLMTLMEIAA